MSTSITVYRPLAVLEALVKDGVGQVKQAYIQVAEALHEIRERKLFKEAGYGSFEAYCEHRWGFTKQAAYTYLRAGQAAEDVKPALPPGKVPSQMQARELAALKSADQRREVVRELDLDKATVRDVKAAVRKKLGKPESLPSKLYSRAVHSPPLAEPPKVNVGLLSSAKPAALHLPKGFLRLELSRDGRGFLSFLVVKDDNGQATTTRQYHHTDADALAYLSSCLAPHDQGGCPDLNVDLAESLSQAPYFPKSDLLDNKEGIQETAAPYFDDMDPLDNKHAVKEEALAQ